MVPSNNYGIQELPRQFMASDELLEIKLQQSIMTMSAPMKAGFHSAVSQRWLPFGFGTVPAERYHLFRIGTTIRPEQWPPVLHY